MNRTFLFLILFAISASTYATSVHVPGYVVTLEQDTIFGEIKIKIDNNSHFIPSSVEDKIVFVPNKGKRKKYVPGSILYFFFFYNFESVTYATVPYFNGQLFMRVISETGFLKMYHYYPDDEKGLSSVYELAEFVYATNFDEIRKTYPPKQDPLVFQR